MGITWKGRGLKMSGSHPKPAHMDAEQFGGEPASEAQSAVPFLRGFLAPITPTPLSCYEGQMSDQKTVGEV